MKKRLFSISLVLIMIVGMIPGNTFAVETGDFTTIEIVDMPNDWSKHALMNAVSNGLLTGYNGKIMPKRRLTRAELAAIINRVFGAKDQASLDQYTDVQEDDWYFEDMAKSVQMKTFNGSNNQLCPDNLVKREEAFAVLNRAFKLPSGNENVLDSFSDKALISDWAIDAAASLVQAGYVVGSDGRLNPKENITRAEFAQLMDNIVKEYIREAGTYTKNIEGNVMINVPNVTLKDMRIKGDLIIGDGVGDGDITLDSIIVTGRTVVRGGGENSIKIKGASSIQNLTIARVNGKVRVYSEEGIEIGETIVDGNDDVIIEGEMGTVTVKASGVTVTATRAKIESGIVEGHHSKIIVSESSEIKTAEIIGEQAEIIVEKGSEINHIIVNGKGTSISGEGEVNEVQARADDISVTTPGAKVTASNGATDIKAGNKSVDEGDTEIVPGKNTGGGSHHGGGSSSNQSSTSPIASYIQVTLMQAVDAINGNMEYQDSAAVIAALPAEIAVALNDASVVNVPITWTDTDNYNSAEVGLYTFTAAWGEMPEGANNNNNLPAPTVELTVPTSPLHFNYNVSGGAIAINGYDISGGTDIIIPAKIKVDDVVYSVKYLMGFRNSEKRSFSIKGIGFGGLTSVIIPSTVVSIGGRAFSGHQLSTITIPEGVRDIGERAFSGNPLTHVYLPKSVMNIGAGAFDYCEELETFIVNPDSLYYSSLDSVLFNKDKTTLIKCPSSKTGSYLIPESVTIISDSAFEYCQGLTGITLPDGLTSIGNSAFSNCSSLAGEIIIPDGVTNIGYDTFGNCSELERITIGDGVLSIGPSAFWNCLNLTDVILGDAVQAIGDRAFYNCNALTHLDLPASVTSIGSDVFWDCTDLTAFNVEAGNNHFSSFDGALFNKDQTILLLYPLGKVGNYVIPDGATTIDQYAFSQCTDLTGVTFPGSMMSIGYLSFASCTGLTEVTIPASVSNIANLAFYGSNIAKITMESDDTSIGSEAFPGYNNKFRTAYEAEGAGTYIYSEGNWTKVRTSGAIEVKTIRSNKLMGKNANWIFQLAFNDLGF